MRDAPREFNYPQLLCGAGRNQFPRVRVRVRATHGHVFEIK